MGHIIRNNNVVAHSAAASGDGFFILWGLGEIFVHSEGRLVFHSVPGWEVGKKERKGHLLCFFSSLFLVGPSALSHCLLAGCPSSNP